MDLGLTEPQKLLQSSAREFLEAECPNTLVRAARDSRLDFPPELWRKIADLGWVGLGIPEEYGGIGGSVADQVVLFEELGRALAPVPLLETGTLGGQILHRLGDKEQRSQYLPNIASGAMVIALALGGPTGSKAGLTARSRRGQRRLSGTASFVDYAGSADYLLCNASSDTGDVLFLVDARSDRLDRFRMGSAADYPQYRVTLRDAPAEGIAEIGLQGEGSDGWARALSVGSVALCAEAVGRAEKVLEMVVAYSKERVQFGRPIGSFQAIQHRCADLRVAVDGARLLTRQSAWRLDRGEDASLEMFMAMHQASAASREATVAGHGIFAGISYTVEHDMQLYSSRARISEASLGDSATRLRAVATLMGLPQ